MGDKLAKGGLSVALSFRFVGFCRLPSLLAPALTVWPLCGHCSQRVYRMPGPPRAPACGRSLPQSEWRGLGVFHVLWVVQPLYESNRSFPR